MLLAPICSAPFTLIQDAVSETRFNRRAGGADRLIWVLQFNLLVCATGIFNNGFLEVTGPSQPQIIELSCVGNFSGPRPEFDSMSRLWIASNSGYLISQRSLSYPCSVVVGPIAEMLPGDYRIAIRQIAWQNAINGAVSNVPIRNAEQMFRIE